MSEVFFKFNPRTQVTVALPLVKKLIALRSYDATSESKHSKVSTDGNIV